jgi:serine phosphatase RsbU (regulator of sigma subunit)
LFSGEQPVDPNLFDPASQPLLGALEPESVLVLPMAARNHLVGVAVMVRQAGRTPFDETDRLLTTDIARRAGLALDNLRLLHVERSTALCLQRALLPALPTNTGLRLAARYLPARDLYSVGGDWYDAFVCPDREETVVLVLGDVAGHDLAAATTMAAIRNLLRGVTITAGPSAVLDTVDRHFHQLGITTPASTILMAASPIPAQLDKPRAWSITWSNAGHLPPVLLHPNGCPELLADLHDPLLATGLPTVRQESTRIVPTDSNLILYSDGLIERRYQDLDSSLNRLLRTAQEAARLARDPDKLLTHILEQLSRSPDDDTAILVAHLP